MAGSLVAHRWIRYGKSSRNSIFESVGSLKRKPLGLVWALENLKVHPSCILSPTRPHHLVFSNSIIRWWSSIPIYEPTGSFLFTTITPKFSFFLNNKFPSLTSSLFPFWSSALQSRSSKAFWFLVDLDLSEAVNSQIFLVSWSPYISANTPSNLWPCLISPLASHWSSMYLSSY